MEIDSTRSGANALGGNGVGAAETDLDRDAFMRLLVAQIRNQDPMDPMDTRDMMAQLTQLTSVEHLIGIQDGINTLQVGTASIANAQVAGFVGKTVTADASQLRLDDAGPASGAFELEGRAAQVTVTVRDGEGRVVRTMELGGQAAGAHTYAWDGNNDDGQRLPAGRYRVQIEAVAESGAPVTSHARVRGTVTGVSYENGYPELLIGEHRVLMGDVREVSDPAPSRPASTTSSGGTNESSTTPSGTSTTPSSPDEIGARTATSTPLLPTNPEAAIASYQSR